LTTPALLRLAAVAGALVLAVTSRGDAVVLAALLALAAWRPAPAISVGAALVATSWRWGSSSLEAIAGAQAVLGPAGWVGPTLAAVGSWLAAIAVVAASPALIGRGPRLVSAAASGAVAAVVVAGPAPGGDLWARAFVGVVGAGLAYVIVAQRFARSRAQVVADAVALLTAGAAVVCVGQEADGWAGTLSADAARDGAVVAAAVAGVVLATRLGQAAMEQRQT